MKVIQSLCVNQDEIDHIRKGNDKAYFSLPIPEPIIKEVETFIKDPYNEVRFYWVVDLPEKEKYISIGLGSAGLFGDGFGDITIKCKYSIELESQLKLICRG